jgi:hypothetical protein
MRAEDLRLEELIQFSDGLVDLARSAADHS